jgi:hypothetical protein
MKDLTGSYTITYDGYPYTIDIQDTYDTLTISTTVDNQTISLSCFKYDFFWQLDSLKIPAALHGLEHLLLQELTNLADDYALDLTIDIPNPTEDWTNLISPFNFEESTETTDYYIRTPFMPF